MGRAHNFSKYFLLYISLFFTCLTLSSHAMQGVDESYIDTLLAGPLREFFKDDKKTATIEDIEIIVDEEGNAHPRWKMLKLGQSGGGSARRYRKAVDENIERKNKNIGIDLKEQHLKTKEKKNAHKLRVSQLEEENERLRAQVVQLQTGFHNEDALRTLRNQMDRLRYTHQRQVKQLTEEMESLREKESDRAKLLKTQISELQDMLTRHGVRVDVNMDVFEGPARSVSRSTVIAANPFIDIVEAIQNDLGTKLKRAEEQNALLLQEISETNEALATQLTENRRLERALEESEFKVTQLESRLVLRQQEFEQAKKDMEHKWIEAMQMQLKITEELEAARKMLREHRLIGEEVRGYKKQKLMEGLTSAASSLGSQSDPNRQALKEQRAKWKEAIQAEHRKNVELGTRVRHLVLDLHKLTTEREAQVALIAGQREMIEQLSRQIQGLEEDSDRFAASNQALRRQLGEVSALLPMPIDGGASSSGPVNALDSLKQRLQLYIQNVDLKQLELQASQEQNEQYKSTIQEWESYHDEMMAQVRAYQAELQTEIARLTTALSEQEEDNQELLLEIEYLEAEKTAMQKILDKVFQTQARLAESEIDGDTDLMSLASVADTSQEPAAAPTAKPSEESAAEAARRYREESQLEFVQRRQTEEMQYLELEEGYQEICATELSERERQIQAKELELKQRRQALENSQVKFKEDEKKLEEKEAMLATLRRDVATLGATVKIRNLQNEMRLSQLERKIFDTEEEKGTLERILNLPYGQSDITPAATSATTPLSSEQALADLLQGINPEEMKDMLVGLVKEVQDLKSQVRRYDFEARERGVSTSGVARPKETGSGHGVQRDDYPGFLTSSGPSAAFVFGETDLTGTSSSSRDDPLKDLL